MGPSQTAPYPTNLAPHKQPGKDAQHLTHQAHRCVVREHAVTSRLHPVSDVSLFAVAVRVILGTPYKISSFPVGSSNFTNVFGEPIVITRDNVKKPRRTSSYYTVFGPLGAPAKIVTQELVAGLVCVTWVAGQVCVSTRVTHGCGWAWPGLGQGLARAWPGLGQGLTRA